MNIFRVAVCDDETMDLKQITETVDCILNSENIDNTIMCYESGDKLSLIHISNQSANQ